MEWEGLKSDGEEEHDDNAVEGHFERHTRLMRL